MAITDTCICVYCLTPSNRRKLTVDHVIARSWFQVDAEDVEKWKAPACGECNGRFSRLEDDLLGRFALCLPKEPAYAQIHARAERARNPEVGKDEPDRARRLRRAEQMAGAIIPDPDLSRPGILPSFRENYEGGSRLGVRIPARLLEEITVKWVRGVHFCEFGRVVAPDTAVTCHVVEDVHAAEAFAKLGPPAKHLQRGSGVEVRIWHVEERGEWSAVYAFDIWQRFRTIGSVDKEGGTPCSAPRMRWQSDLE